MKAPQIVIGLGALLGFCALLLLFGKSETEAWPSSFHTGPSGLAALERLLQKDGYKTTANRSPLLPTNSNDLIIAPIITDRAKTFMSIISREETRPIDRALARHVAKGGRLIQVQVPLDFNRGSRDLVSMVVEGRNSEFDIDSTFPSSNTPEMLTDVTLPGSSRPILPSEPMPLYVLADSEGNDSQAVARIQTLGEGTAVSLDSGLMAINRHLGDKENADLVMDIVRRLAPPGTRIVFAEATFGNATEGGLGGALGSWFSAARNQTIILLLTVCVTLGIRFGRRRPVKYSVKGARDMVDALATQLASTNDRVFVLKCLAKQVETEMKKLEGLGNHSPSTDLLRVLPDRERQVIAYTLNLPTSATISRSDAVSHAKELEKVLASARQRAKERSLIRAS